MGILNKLFSGEGKAPKETPNKLPWKELKTVGQLDVIQTHSKDRPQVIFKHSTRCGISSMVMKNFERSYKIAEEAIDLYYLDLLSFREVSNEIASKFQVFHESPQMIIIKNEQTVYHASHSTIDPKDIDQFLG